MARSAFKFLAIYNESMVQPNTTLGSYRLIERIGVGGMGEVWKAEDTRLSRVVAIKIVPPSVTADAEAIARLRREARTAAQLNHPNIATIHSIEEGDGRLFIVMEFVDGEPLAKMLERGVSEAELCRIGRSVADALAEAHAKGIIHRDIKPDNIIVSGVRVRVLDFGIAKQVGTAASGPDAPTAALVTQQGMIVGTIQYMSPEQALGKPLDPRTDIFSLGIVLYEGATGRLPFQGETITETMTQIIRDEAQEPLRVNPKISPGLNDIIQRCLRKNRDERYASAADLGRALEQQLGRASTAPYTEASALTGSRLQTVSEPRRKSHWIWIAAAIAIVVGVAVVMQHRRVAAGVPPAVERPRTAAPTQTTPPPARPPALLAQEHFQIGEAALFNRDFAKAVEHYQQALDQKDQLDPRQQELSQLGIAIALHRRVEAEEIAKEIGRRWPGDPALVRSRREFAGMAGGEQQQRPFGRRRRP